MIHLPSLITNFLYFSDDDNNNNYNNNTHRHSRVQAGDGGRAGEAGAAGQRPGAAQGQEGGAVRQINGSLIGDN